jgi:hypothetical protein
MFKDSIEYTQIDKIGTLLHKFLSKPKFIPRHLLFSPSPQSLPQLLLRDQHIQD